MTRREMSDDVRAWIQTTAWWLTFAGVLGGVAWLATGAGRMRGVDAGSGETNGPATPAVGGEEKGREGDAEPLSRDLKRAESDLRAGRWAEAEETFLLLSGFPALAVRAWLGAGAARLALQRNEEAVSAFTAVLKHNPPEFRAGALLGRTVALRDLGRIEESMLSWNFFLSASGGDPRRKWDDRMTDEEIKAIYFVGEANGAAPSRVKP